MSHAHGQIIINNEVVGYYEYDGTADVAVSHIYDTEEEVNDNWRSGLWTDCNCGEPPLDAFIYTNYGSGFHWEGKVCLHCHAIVGGTGPFGEDEVEIVNGYPILGMKMPWERGG